MKRIMHKHIDEKKKYNNNNWLWQMCNSYIHNVIQSRTERRRKKKKTEWNKWEPHTLKRTTIESNNYIVFVVKIELNLKKIRSFSFFIDIKIMITWEHRTQRTYNNIITNVSFENNYMNFDKQETYATCMEWWKRKWFGFMKIGKKNQNKNTFSYSNYNECHTFQPLVEPFLFFSTS